MEVRNLILQYGAGWSHTLEEVHDKDSRAREAQFDTSRYLPRGEQLQRLMQLQGPDVKLYAFAQVGAWRGRCW